MIKRKFNSRVKNKEYNPDRLPTNILIASILCLIFAILMHSFLPSLSGGIFNPIPLMVGLYTAGGIGAFIAGGIWFCRYT